MTIESRIRQYGKVFGHWQIKERLGWEGTAAFRLVHTELEGEESALKVICLIEEQGDHRVISPYRKMQYAEARERCRKRAEQEVLLMSGLQGCANVVKYLEHTIMDWSDEESYGCDMLIRTEPLKALQHSIQEGVLFREQEVVRIGQDICKALVLYHRKEIIHRDIRPESIFFNEEGTFKLGGFGVSRASNEGPLSMASPGTGASRYWAPEQTRESYGSRSDIYSLGLVLYQLCNGNRLPAASRVHGMEGGIHRKMAPQSLPPLPDIDPSLEAVILKACAPEPRDRYQTAGEFLEALNGIDPGSRAIFRTEREVPITARETQRASIAYELNEWEDQRAGLEHRAFSREDGGAEWIPQRTTGLDIFQTQDTSEQSQEPVQNSPGEKRLSWEAEDRKERREKRSLPLWWILPLCLAACVIAAAAFFLSGKQEDQAPATEPSVGQEETTAQEGTTPPTVQEAEDPLEAAYRAAQAQAEELAAEEDYDGALACLQEQAKAYPADDRYAALIAELQNRHRDSIKGAAAQYAREGSYVRAIGLLDDAWRTYGEEAYLGLAVEYRMEFGQYVNSVMAAGKYNSALIQNGEVYVIGDNEFGELGGNSWQGITAVSVGDRFVMGLNEDGTVSMSGHYTTTDRAYSPGWENIVAIAAGDCHAVALTGTGRVVAMGYNGHKQTDVNTLMQLAGDEKIVAVSAGYTHTLALLEDGTVVACGDNSKGACNVGTWSDVAAISAGSEFSAALMTDGTVRVTGMYAEVFDASQWRDIKQIAAGDYFLIGLKEDGTMVSAVLDVSNRNHGDEGQLDVYHLENIVRIAAGHNHTLALDAEGTLHCLGYKARGACDVDGWQLD